MKIKRNQIVEINQVLDILSNVKNPFSVMIAKNKKLITPLLESYMEDRNIIVDKYATKNENGEYVGRMNKDEETRIQNPTRFVDMDISNLEDLIKAVKIFDETEIEMHLESIPKDKEYWDSRCSKMLPILSFIDSEIDSNVVILMDKYEIISL